MYGENYQCKFETEKGSVYTVGKGSVKRAKSDGTDHENPKNILYAKKDVGGEILELKGKRKTVPRLRIQDESGTWTMEFFDTMNKSVAKFTLAHEPKKGLSPVDVMVDSDGWNEEERRLHVGHPIEKLM